MEFQQFGRVNPDKMYKINPMQLAENVILKRLDFLLGFIKERNEKQYNKYVEQLEKIIQNLIGSFDIPKEKLEIKEKLSSYKHLNQHSKLAKIHYHFLLKLLEKPIEEAINSEEVLIPSKNYWLIVFGIRYYQAQALTEIMEKEEAIELFKEYIDQYYVSVKSTFKHFETLDEMRNDHFEDSENSTDPEFDVIYSTVEDGVYIVRNNNCPAIDALSDFEDKELVYVACCHGDYQYAVMSNEHFVMTRDFTVAEGDPYCDKVFHDTRIDKELKHPSKEFLDGMGPILKKNKK
ncbi:MAG: L-2-amino-thiazoline-4-carboxylic acid hydrolase [Candidatus Heimdallarchaeota archaeon]|nr:L-2-amino-thiazoline-4-carboxylic acid hydrolase [Candidatus Heimdallarchaeota archaeon]